MTAPKENVKNRHVIMLASENDALRGGKVGGVGDVVRDLPAALASLGWSTTIIIPSYGFLHIDNPSRFLKSVQFPFGGKNHQGDFHEVTPRRSLAGVKHLVFEHPEIRGEPIYCNDPPGETFARDATKYALFCSAIGQYLRDVDPSTVLHLHDWHMATLLLLQRMHPAFRHLALFRTVFTVHNLAIQGSRPMQGKLATVQEWFPELFQDLSWIPHWSDDRFQEPTYTPMAAGIRYSTRLNTVSPSYAEEILLPSDHEKGFYGGEGLEQFLQQAKAENRLFGILNGAEYPHDRISRKMSWAQMCELIEKELGAEARKNTFHSEIISRVRLLKEHKPSVVLTSVTRIVEQKIQLLFENTSAGRTVIEDVCALLKNNEGLYIILGTGTSDYEQKLVELSRRCERFIFLNVYSDLLSEASYANGTLFMMPSSFEPCGIGQMIAMRDGQPCLVHAVGGLKDTVIDGINGFCFAGSTRGEQADNLVAAARRAIETALKDPPTWEKICRNAAAVRFTWEKSARQYSDLLYS